MKKLICLFIIVLFSVLLLNPLYAQEGKEKRRLSRGKGRLEGKVLDKAKNPIRNAKVVLLFEDNIAKFETTTDKKGVWSVIALGTGKFRVTASADGYIPANTLVFVRQLSKNPPVIFKLKSMSKAVVSEDRSAITKTYFLKHINPKEAKNALKLYFWRCSYDSNKKMLCVDIPKKNIKKFEELLRKLDVKKRNIYFRIFTVIASHTGKSSEIKNKDLKKVIYELSKVLSFNCFRLDGVSFISVQEGARGSVVNLSTSTRSRLTLNLRGITINGYEKGKRFIEIEDLFLYDIGKNLVRTSTSNIGTNFIRTSTSINENGYLVVGVSKIGENGDSLILVINAEIK